MVECYTRYQPNYYVTNACNPDAVRQYYGGIPEYIEVGEFHYVEPPLVENFRRQMAISQ